jgi:hypothetical protein
MARTAGATCALEDDELPMNGLKIKLPLPDVSAKIGESISAAAEIARSIYLKTKFELVAISRNSSVIAEFNFPNHHQAACMQYLAYFSEFLRLIDVDANSELSSESKNVLLSVTPTDGKVALALVKAALGVYLRLPDGAVTDAAFKDSDAAIRNLASTVIHFRDLVAATSHSALISGSEPKTLADSATQCASGGAVESKASFFGGRLLIKKLERGPLEIDLPRIISEFKLRFPILKRLE